MKFRLGFVANSSSASFIVTAKVTKDDLITCLGDRYRFSAHRYVNLLKDDIEYLENIIKEKTDDIENTRKMSIERFEIEYFEKTLKEIVEQFDKDILNYKKAIEQKKERLAYVEKTFIEKEITKEQKFELLKEITEYNHVFIRPSEDNTAWEFDSFSGMYNDFSDMKDDMIDIIFSLIEHGCKDIDLKVEK